MRLFRRQTNEALQLARELSGELALHQQFHSICSTERVYGVSMQEAIDAIAKHLEIRIVGHVQQESRDIKVIPDTLLSPMEEAVRERSRTRKSR